MNIPLIRRFGLPLVPIAVAAFLLAGCNDSDIVGTLNATENGCGFTGVTFQGTLQGTTLHGTVTGDRFSNGTAKGTTLEIALTSSCPGELCIPGGQMHLHR